MNKEMWNQKIELKRFDMATTSDCGVPLVYSRCSRLMCVAVIFVTSNSFLVCSFRTEIFRDCAQPTNKKIQNSINRCRCDNEFHVQPMHFSTLSSCRLPTAFARSVRVIWIYIWRVSFVEQSRQWLSLLMMMSIEIPFDSLCSLFALYLPLSISVSFIFFFSEINFESDD